MIGVLALQGDFEAHLRALERLGVTGHEIRRPAQCAELSGLIIPGGESTTLLRLMDFEPGWFEAIAGLAERGGALLGTCAGLILLARAVQPAQRSLGLLNVDVVRNAYGRQRESFVADGGGLEMVFIRAPRIEAVGDGVEVLARHDGVPVWVAQGRVFGASFHPELGIDSRVHRAFLDAAGNLENPISIRF